MITNARSKVSFSALKLLLPKRMIRNCDEYVPNFAVIIVRVRIKSEGKPTIIAIACDFSK